MWALNIVSPVSRNANQRFFTVHRVGLIRQVAQIVPFVVGSIGVFMINKARRLFAGHQKPGNAVCAIMTPLITDRVITVFLRKLPALLMTL